MLFLMDNYWQEHLVSLDELRRGIGLRAYAQVKPLDAYRNESYDLFSEMLMCIRGDMLKNFVNLYRNTLEQSAKHNLKVV